MVLHKLVLGSAQWGMDYGVSNNLGKTTLEEVRKIAEISRLNNINQIDTASAYGESHSRIATYFPEETKIITKIPPIRSVFQSREEYKKELRIYLERCMESLNACHLHGLLLHDINDISSEYADELFDFLSSIKKAGVVSKIGVSIYSESDLHNACKSYDWDLIQIPFNVFDQRFKNNDHITRFRQQGGEIYARSIFLQGLLLTKPSQIPSQLKQWLPQLNEWQLFCDEMNISDLQACISLAFNQNWIDYCILGIAESLQLEENIQLINASMPISCEFLAQNDLLELIDPRKWKS